jgi:hypothetical protein
MAERTGGPAVGLEERPMFEGFTRTEIATGGARIHLRHGGEGPPLLLLHGNR